MAKNYNLTYYPWITQHSAPEIIRKNIEIFAAEVGKELSKSLGEDVTVTVLEPLEVPAQIKSIAEGGSQISLMNPLGFVFAKERNKNINVAALALRVIDGTVGESYFAQIYTHINTGIKTLLELRKRSMGFGSSQSTSNFLIPGFELKENGVHPLTSFKRTEFIGGHDSVAKAVYEGEIEVGAGHDGVITALAAQPGYSDAKEKLIMIHRTNPIPSDPVAVNVPTAEEFKEIQKAVVKVSKKEPAKTAIFTFWGESAGLKKISYKPYKYLIDAVKKLSLTEPDIFG
jgi:phosphate/phosphite/phosphonate ABC transporter binding protein